jgi:hypothetical protein
MPLPLLWFRRGTAITLLGFFSAVLVVGCGSDGVGRLHPVQGKVLVDDQPLTKGSVRFVPDTSRGNTAKHEPVGEIGGDGLYVLTTTGKVGAPAGWYKVSVVSTDPPDSTKPNAIKSYVGRKYIDTATSGLTVEVVASPAAGAYDLKVTNK